MTSGRGRLPCGIALATILLASPARAADPRAEAAEFFRAGTAAYERHEFRAAALAFEEAYKRAPRGAVAYNAGLAWQGAGDAPRAADAYDLAVADPNLDAPSREDARTRLDVLRATLASVRITAPVGDAVSVAHVDRARIPRTIHLAPGRYVLELVVDGKSASHRTFDAQVGSSSIALERPPPPPEAAHAHRSSILPILGWASIGTAAALTGTAIVVGLEATRERNEFDKTGDTDASLRSRAITLRTITNVAWAAAAVLAVTGVTLLILAPAPAHDGATASLRLRF